MSSETDAKKGKGGGLSMKKIIFFVVLLLIVGLGVYMYFEEDDDDPSTMNAEFAKLREKKKFSKAEQKKIMKLFLKKYTPPGHDYLFELDRDDISMRFFTDLEPNWKGLAWKDQYLEKVAEADIEKFVEESEVPVGAMFYQQDSDLHRFDAKRFWSKTAKYFTERTGYEIKFVMVRVTHLADSMEFYEKYKINVISSRGNYYYIPAGRFDQAVPIPYRGSSVEVMEDLKVICEPPALFINATTPKMLKMTAMDRSPKEAFSAKYSGRTIFMFVEEKQKFSPVQQLVSDMAFASRKDFQLFQTSNLTIAEELNVEGSAVKYGDAVYFRYEDEAAVAISEDCTTKEKLLSFLDENTMPKSFVHDMNSMSMKGIEKLSEILTATEGKKLIIRVVFDEGKKKNKQKVIKISNKIREKFKHDENLFPHITLTPKSDFVMDQQINGKDEDMSDYTNFMIIRSEYLRPKQQTIKKEYASVFAFEEIEKQLEILREQIAKLDEDKDEL